MCPTTAPSTACRSRRRRGRCRSSMAVPFVGSHPGRASGISAGCGGQPLPAAMWGLSLGERDHLLNLDFDPTVVGIASQPFWLHWIDAAGKSDWHAPDFFARRSDGSAWWSTAGRWSGAGRGTSRSSRRRHGPARWRGWEYRLLGEVDALVTANLRWFAGYRHPRHHLAETVDASQSSTGRDSCACCCWWGCRLGSAARRLRGPVRSAGPGCRSADGTGFCSGPKPAYTA